MKRLFSMFAVIFAVALYSTSCETDGDLDDYTPPELSEWVVSEFAPVITSLVPGYERLQVSWTLPEIEGSDATIEYCYLFSDAGVFEINMSSSSVTVESGVYSTIVDMDEGTYDFYMKSLDSENNLTGAGAKESVFVYGDEYIDASSAHRTILRSSYAGNTHTLTMTDSYDSSVQKVRVYYVNVSDAEDNDFILSAETERTADVRPSYLGVTEDYEPATTSYTIPNVEADVYVLVETVIAPFAEVLDEITITATKRLSEKATFVEVSSLETLRLYTTADTEYTNVKMTPGTYSFSIDDAQSGNFSTVEIYYGTVKPAVICIKGNNNNYDFSGVTIEIADDAGDNCYDAETGSSMGTELSGLHILGSNNTVRGINLIDLYDAETTPSNGYTNVTIDGRDNLVEDIYVFSTGSSPYRYGEVFGKGSTYTIGHSKHCSLLLRGDYNTIRRCTLLHYAYGHSMFMQGAWHARIEDCLFESERCSTNDILAEAGTGTSADLIDFQTANGYKLPPNYSLSVSEDSVRSYTTGVTVVDGVRYQDDSNGVTTVGADGKTYWPDGLVYGGAERGSGPIFSRGNTSKHTRTSSALYLGTGAGYDSNWTSGFTKEAGATNFRHVEHCTMLAGQDGFSVRNSGTVLQCKAAPTNGSVSGSTYYNDSNITYEIEIVPFDGDKMDGNGQGLVARLWGSGHTYTLTASDDYQYDDFTLNTNYRYNSDGKLYIALGGWSTNWGSLKSQYLPDYDTDNYLRSTTFNNSTDFLIVLSAASGSSSSNGNTINNYGDEEVIVLGSYNTINNYGNRNVINLGSNNTINQRGSGQTKTSANGYTEDYRRYKSYEEEMATGAYN